MQPHLEAACARELDSNKGTDSSNTGSSTQCGLGVGNPETLDADPVQCLIARMVAPSTGRSVDGELYSSEGLSDTCRTAVAGVLRRRQGNWRLDPGLAAACRWELRDTSWGYVLKL